MYYAIIDKKHLDRCAGIGIYFILAETSEEAKNLAKKRCEEEMDYDDSVFWKVTEIHKIPDSMTINELLKRETWLLLK